MFISHWDNRVLETKYIHKELEHCSQNCQLHHRPRHDRRHIYSVRHQYHPYANVTPANFFLIRLSVQAIFWQQMVVDLHVTYTELNRAMSVNFVGLAMGCYLFIPLAKKFGRRPIYIVSTMLMVATSFWSASLTSLTDLYVSNLLQGLAGATNEAIVEITVGTKHENW